MGARDNLGGPWEEAARTDRPPAPPVRLVASRKMLNVST